MTYSGGSVFVDPAVYRIFLLFIGAATAAEFFQVSTHHGKHVFHQAMLFAVSVAGHIDGAVYLDPDDYAGIYLQSLRHDHSAASFQRNWHQGHLGLQREGEGATVKFAEIAVAAARSFGKSNGVDATVNDLRCRYDALGGFPRIFPVDRNVSGPPHVPSHKGNPKQRSFGYPPELDWQPGGQGKNIVQAAMIGDEELRPGSIDLLEPFDLHPGSAQPEIISRPPPHAEVLDPSAAGNKAAHNGDRGPECGAKTATGPAPEGIDLRLEPFHENSSEYDPFA
jgi:hypothetical protein